MKSRNFVNFIVILFNRVLIFLSLREGSRRYWGIVYDSVTKQPLDPVAVKLISVDSGSVIQSCITDLYGRYGFLVNPGRYKIFAAKAHYRFPSQNLTKESDGIYSDLYHNEYIEVLGDSEVIAPNIPMDPLEFDWNQQAKKEYYTKYPYFTELLKRIIELFFWFIFVLSLVVFSYNFTKSLSIVFNWSFYVLVGYLFLLMLNKIIPSVRLWGRVIDKRTKQPGDNLQVELINLAVPDIVIARTKTSFDGKFFLRTNKGRYLLRLKATKASQSIDIGSKKIRVFKEGVVNQNIYF